MSAILALFVVAGAQAGDAPTFTEDFTTTALRDGANTTAVWDTGTAELHAEPFQFASYPNVDTPGNPVGVTVAGDILYVADRSGGVGIYDISVPTSPVWLATHPTPDAWSVHAGASRIYVADASLGLVIVDVTDPSNPVQLGATTSTFPGTDVEVHGHLAYVTDAGTHLRIFDVGDPAAPVEVGAQILAGTGYSVDVVGATAFVAQGLGGLGVIDVSDPTSPTMIGQYDTPGNTWGVSVSGQVAYIGDNNLGAASIDVGDPTSPILLDQIVYGARRLVARGDRLYSAVQASGSSVIDISDPENMVMIHTFYPPPGVASDVTVSGGIVYEAAGTGGGIRVHRAADAAPPAIAAQIPASGQFSMPRSAILGDVVWVSVSLQPGMRLEAWDVRDPSLPSLLGSLVVSTTASPVDLLVEDGLAYLSGTSSDLFVVDVSDPAAMTILSQTSVGSWMEFDLAGSLLYASAGSSLNVVDVRDPALPVVVHSQLAIAGDLEIDGSRLYVSRIGSVSVYDVGVGGIPVPVGSVGVPGCGSGGRFEVEGNFLYRTCGTSLAVFDIADPAAIQPVGGWSNPDLELVDDVAVVGDRALLALRGNTTAPYEQFLAVLDVSDPADPVELRRRSLGSTIDSTPALDFGVRAGQLVTLGRAIQGASEVDLVWLLQEEILSSSVQAQSLPVVSGPDTVRKVRLNSVASGSPAAWSIAAGGPFEPIASGGDWLTLATPGSSLEWRALLDWTGPGSASVIDSVTIQWLVDAPVIGKVVDIPGDQGRRVRVSWTRSSLDFVGEDPQITDYAVYRRIDPGLINPVDTEEFGSGGATGTAARRAELVDWDFVALVPARAVQTYSVVVPTLADSTIAEGQHLTSFFVSALTASPTVYFDSLPDSGYSVDNLAPAEPLNLVAHFNTGVGNQLDWDPPTDEDFATFRVYRGAEPGFAPDQGALVGETTASSWTDPDEDGGTFFYKVSAVDFSGNESDFAVPGTITASDPAPAWRRLALHPNVPNPFNPRTLIRYEIPAPGGRARLQIYDLAGRRIRVLVDGHREEGEHRVSWDGTDATGRAVASGPYLMRLEVGQDVLTRKMTLLK